MSETQTRPQQEVSDLVCTSMVDSIEITKQMFGLDGHLELVPFTKVILACRALSKESYPEVVVPIVEKLLKELDLDPVNSNEDRTAAIAYVEIFSTAISDATQMIYQQMQQQVQQRQANAQALQRGNAGLIT